MTPRLSGKAGNKGGVVVRFLLHSTSLCFVCSHLAAHQTKVTERNQDVHDICTKVQFPHGQTLESHDYVFWCGDLNYRIDLPTNVAKEHIAGRRWENLVLQDQLIKQRKSKKKIARQRSTDVCGEINSTTHVEVVK